MARLLLSWARMKVWALVPLLASSGCLFLDGLNRPPVVSLSAGISGSLTGVKGDMINLHYTVTDDESSDESFNVQFLVEDATTGEQLTLPCDYADGASNGNYQIQFFHAGTFLITASTNDRHGSPSNTSSVMVAITDAPPIFAPDVMVIPTTKTDFCGLNTAGDVVSFQLKGVVNDADQFAAAPYPQCPRAETITYQWRISGQPSGTKPVLTLFDGSSCAAPTPTSGPTVHAPDSKAQVCLWTDPMIVGSTAMYSVVLDVSDGTSSATSPAGDLPVGADQPPCITGTDPIAGSYVVDRTQLQEFQVDGVVDDRDVFGSSGATAITYAWSVWRESDPSWRAVPSWTTSTYQLDVSSFGVGENVRVRVEAIDRTGALVSPASCPVDADDCVVTSCASSPNVCHKWKTWDLELR